MASHLDQVKRVFRAVVDRQFPLADIVTVDVREDTDFEDKDVLRVTVVFDSGDQFDVRAASGFVRHVRPALEEIDEHRFPIMSYMTKEDWDEIRGA